MFHSAAQADQWSGVRPHSWEVRGFGTGKAGIEMDVRKCFVEWLVIQLLLLWCSVAEQSRSSGFNFICDVCWKPTGKPTPFDRLGLNSRWTLLWKAVSPEVRGGSGARLPEFESQFYLLLAGMFGHVFASVSSFVTWDYDSNLPDAVNIYNIPTTFLLQVNDYYFYWQNSTLDATQFVIKVFLQWEEVLWLWRHVGWGDDFRA